MDALRYRAGRLFADDLEVGECTVHRASDSRAARWWLLWFRVPRDTDGQPALYCVPVQLGPYTETGPGGKTWGLALRGLAGEWQVTPSINVIDTGDAHAGAHPAPSLWHHTPVIVGVPDGEPWTTGAAP